MNHLRLSRYLLTLTTLMAVLWCDIRSVHSATRIGWETPHYIPGLVDSFLSPNPCFVVDPAGKLHMFHSQIAGDRQVIVYTNWTVGIGWAIPVDIISFEIGDARITGAFLDDNGMMNLVFWGSNVENGIYFTKAPLPEVMRSGSWSSPQLIGSDALIATTAPITSDQHGYLAVVYAGNREGRNGLYSMVSYDYGATWTVPSLVYLSGTDDLEPLAINLIIGQNGSVHAVWAEGSEDGLGLRVYYASLARGVFLWSSPIILAEAVNYEANTPNIIEHDGNLIVIFHNDFPTTRHMTMSSDNGETWSLPVRLFEQVGSNGSAGFVVDGNNTLHMFFGNRIDGSSTHGAWHSIWEDGGWSAPKAVVAGPQILRGTFNEEGFDPWDVQAVFCYENILFVAWRHDPVAGSHIWFTYQYLDMPALPTLAVRMPTVGVTITPENEQLLPDISSMEEDINPNVDYSNSLSAAELLFYSLVPALLLIVVLLLWRQNRK